MCDGEYESAMGRLARWRSPLAAWQTGPREYGDPESAAVRDLWQRVLIQRCELTGLLSVLTERGIVRVGEFRDACTLEAERLCVELEGLFPGVVSTDAGLIRVNGYGGSADAWGRG